jgi:hypothetical protein
MLKLEPLLGGLKLAMTMGDVDFFTTGTSKRCIIDKRKLL